MEVKKFVWRHFASIVKSITLFTESGEKKSQIELENEIVLRFPESNEKSTKSSTVGVNFTNILGAAFSYKIIFLHTFFLCVQLAM
jgi:hypothetical protein